MVTSGTASRSASLAAPSTPSATAGSGCLRWWKSSRRRRRRRRCRRPSSLEAPLACDHGTSREVAALAPCTSQVPLAPLPPRSPSPSLSSPIPHALSCVRFLYRLLRVGGGSVLARDCRGEIVRRCCPSAAAWSLCDVGPIPVGPLILYTSGLRYMCSVCAPVWHTYSSLRASSISKWHISRYKTLI